MSWYLRANLLQQTSRKPLRSACHQPSLTSLPCAPYLRRALVRSSHDANTNHDNQFTKPDGLDFFLFSGSRVSCSSLSAKQHTFQMHGFPGNYLCNGPLKPQPSSQPDDHSAGQRQSHAISSEQPSWSSPALHYKAITVVLEKGTRAIEPLSFLHGRR